MVSYSTGAAVLMAITGLVNAAERTSSRPIAEEKHLREAHTQQERRALYSPDIKTDKETKCHNVIEGKPEVCILVCTEVTSHWATNKLLDETSKTSQRECKNGWQNDGHSEDLTYSPSTSWPTYSPTSPWSGDGHTTKGDGHKRVADWNDDGWDSYSSSSKDAWGPSFKCVSRSNKVRACLVVACLMLV